MGNVQLGLHAKLENAHRGYTRVCTEENSVALKREEDGRPAGSARHTHQTRRLRSICTKATTSNMHNSKASNTIKESPSLITSISASRPVVR